MGDSGMKLTRRKLAGVLAAVPAAGALAAQTTGQTAAQASAEVDEETTHARETLRNNLAQIAKVKVDRAVEPAFRFKA
jgi:ribosomal protein L12E/L44/L45/RPP1/RPP2